MTAWLRVHRHALRSAIGKFRAQGFAGLLGVIGIAIALALPAGGYAVLESLLPSARQGTFDPTVTVFLRPEISREEADAFGRKLRADRRISDLRFISREAAAKELASIEGFGDVLDALGRNPLPDSWILTFASSQPADLEAFAAELGRASQVARVQLEALWAKRLAAIASVGRAAVLFLSVLFACGLVAITFNGIRLQILTLRDEIEVSQLIGADDAFIRRPFHYLGVLQGAAGALLALMVVEVGIFLMNREIGVLAETYASSFRLSGLSAGDSIGLVVFAAFLGLAGAHLSVRRHLGGQ